MGTPAALILAAWSLAAPAPLDLSSWAAMPPAGPGWAPIIRPAPGPATPTAARPRPPALYWVAPIAPACSTGRCPR
jgi:hypothetical protein